MRKMSVDGANKTRGVLPIITCTGRLRLKGEPFPGTVYEQGFHQLKYIKGKGKLAFRLPPPPRK